MHTQKKIIFWGMLGLSVRGALGIFREVVGPRSFLRINSLVSGLE